MEGEFEVIGEGVGGLVTSEWWVDGVVRTVCQCRGRKRQSPITNN
jgi:hypothetical protein